MTRDPLDAHAASPRELRDRLAAERRGAPFLLYRDADDRQVIVELEGERLTIGRSTRSDVALHWDAEVSRLHAELERIGGDWVIGDDQLSHNRTYLNGDRVRTRRRLKNGDVVTAGSTQIAFLAPVPGSRSATVTVGHPLAGIAVTPAQRRALVALCRPLPTSGAPASNHQIAGELVVAVDTVKATLGRLFQAFGIGDDVPQNQKRAILARRALQTGIVRRDEL